MRTLTFVLLVLSLAACSKAKPPTAKEAADKLAAAGILTNCKQAVPRALTARASEYWSCDLPSVPGKGASVLAFADDEAFEATVKAFEGAAMLAGAHRYGNAKARIFVQMNEGASLEIGQKTKAIVEALGTSDVDEVVKQNTAIATSAAAPPQSIVSAPSSSAAASPALKPGRPAMRSDHGRDAEAHRARARFAAHGSLRVPRGRRARAHRGHRSQGAEEGSAEAAA